MNAIHFTDKLACYINSLCYPIMMTIDVSPPFRKITLTLDKVRSKRQWQYSAFFWAHQTLPQCYFCGESSHWDPCGWFYIRKVRICALLNSMVKNWQNTLLSDIASNCYRISPHADLEHLLWFSGRCGFTLFWTQSITYKVLNDK